MTQPIDNPQYWKSRLDAATTAGELWKSVFVCPEDRWLRIEEKHRQILAKYIGDIDDVLDCGCGYGRLLNMLPTTWIGHYLGIDSSPDMIELAKRTHPWPFVRFAVGDLRDAESFANMHYGTFQWAVLVSVRPMVRRNLGDDAWAKMEANVRRVALNILYLEYDEADEGSVVRCE